MKLRNVYIVVSMGMVYRDVVRLGMLRHLLDSAPDIRVILLTQAYAVSEVQEEVRHERVIVARHDYFSSRTRWPSWAAYYRRKQSRRFSIEALLKAEAALSPPRPALEELFTRYPPSLVVSTHPLILAEWDVITYARKRGIRTASVIRSWDNVLRRPEARADRIAVWGRANAREAIEVERYREDEVAMVGALAFDRYFTASVIKPREEFWCSKGLDPSRPIILFGTAGSFTFDWDETFLMDLLLEMTEQTEELREVQIVCRLHLMSRLEHFWRYRENARVHLSFGSYVKTLGWCMTRDEVDDMANMLRHSDLVITPASTLCIEGPIFDAPTIATFFSTVRPDLHREATEKGWLNMHFKPVATNGWLPMAKTPDELRAMICSALRDRSLFREGRRALVDEYVTFTDGKSFERVAAFIDAASRRVEAGS